MKIFITGATGYIGGSIAQRFTDDGHTVTGLVRSAEDAKPLAEHGINPIVGDLDNADLLVAEAGKVDVIVNAANTLHLEAAKALVQGARADARILHTSGIGAYSEDGEGELRGKVVTDDLTIPAVGPHPAQELLRRVEQVFLDAASNGKHTVVLSNSLIYGEGFGLTRESTQIPMMARAARDKGHVTVVGAGKNIWSTVHIADVVELYMLALAKAPAGAFYLVENGEASFLAIGRALADRLKLGEPRLLPLTDASAVYGEMAARYLLGTSSRVRGVRARRELGWEPKHGSAVDWIATEMTV